MKVYSVNLGLVKTEQVFLTHAHDRSTVLHLWRQQDLFNQCPSSGYLGCFSIFAITNSATMDCFVYTSFHRFAGVSSGKIPTSRLSG